MVGGEELWMRKESCVIWGMFALARRHFEQRLPIASVKGSCGLSCRNHTSHNCATSRSMRVLRLSPGVFTRVLMGWCMYVVGVSIIESLEERVGEKRKAGRCAIFCGEAEAEEGRRVPCRPCAVEPRYIDNGFGTQEEAQEKAQELCCK